MTNCGRKLKNPNVTKLKDRHPATGGSVYGADDHNVGGDDPPFPNGPATKSRRLSLIWRRTLSRPPYNSRRLSIITQHISQQTDLKEGRHRATYMKGKLCNSDWVPGWRLISDLDLSLEFFVSRPLIYTEYRQQILHNNTRPMTRTTYPDTDIRRRFPPELGLRSGITEGVATTVDGVV